MKRKALKKRKLKTKIAASGLFAAASKKADEEEDRLFEQNKQYMQDEEQRANTEPKALPKDNQLARTTMETRKNFRHGRMIYKSSNPITPIVRSGVKPGIGGRKLPTFFDTTKDLQEASGPFAVERKKSRFQKQQEHKEAKRKKDEELTASIYEDFVSSFDPIEEKDADADGNKAKKGKLSKLNSLVEKMKENQDDDLTGATNNYTAPVVVEDESTNIYVGNLASSVTEEVLTRIFGKHGPLVSVKIMWPRGEEQKNRPHNCGFVAFKNRSDAENAFFSLDNVDIEGSKINLDWGKPLKDIGAMKILPYTVSQEENNMNTVNGSNTPQSERKNQLGFDGREAAVLAKIRSRARFSDPVLSSGVTETITFPLAKKDIFLLITRTAEFVARDGELFENMLRVREQHNPDYFWLFDDNCLENVYYRWRVLAFTNGERLLDYSMEPFRFYTSDRTWFKPPAATDSEFLTCMEACQKLRNGAARARENKTKYENDNDSFGRRGHRRGRGEMGTTGAANDRRRRNAKLRTKQKEKLLKLLRRATLQKTTILPVMGFCLDFAECAQDCSSLLLQPFEDYRKNVQKPQDDAESKSADPGELIARLHCISDILFNSNAAVRNASMYRTLLQAKMPLVFHVLGLCYKRASGRLTAQAIQTRVFTVLNAWRQRFLMSPRFLNGLEISFHRASEKTETSVGNEVTTGKVTEQKEKAKDESNELVVKANLIGIYTADVDIDDLKQMIDEVERDIKQDGRHSSRKQTC